MRPTDALTPAEPSTAEHDLGPLAWVLDELRKSLDGAVKALRRFVRDAAQSPGSDLASVDASQLRVARQQLHQASGALEMVGMSQPTVMLRAMEAAVQRCVQRPELCNDHAANTIERASFALAEFLEALLAGKPASAVALFPQYREVQLLAGAERAHPADLFPVERRMGEPDTIASAPSALSANPAVRGRMDHALLRVVKRGDRDAARELAGIALGLAAGNADRAQRTFWKLAAGFFESLADGLVPTDVYAKRVASRILTQVGAFQRGDAQAPDRLLQDLLFFASQARPSDSQAPALQAVRNAYGLHRHLPVDYESRRYGRFDPAVLVQARKRIAAAAETWSALAGGDRNKLKPATDQFSLVADSLHRLHPESEPLGQALMQAVEGAARANEVPSAPVAMEVATAVLYLQAVYEELDVDDGRLTERAARLADRLDGVRAGSEPEPLEGWMEDLYRRVSDRQTMGSVVEELRGNLGEIEKELDQFFRQPEDNGPLVAVPGQLAQMRGVLSVLGLDEASHAVTRMRDGVERLLAGGVPDADRAPMFERLGNSLGALGFLIDMLSYQRQLARKLFVFDEDAGELRMVVGRQRARSGDPEEVATQHVDARAAEDSAFDGLDAAGTAAVPSQLQPLALPASGGSGTGADSAATAAHLAVLSTPPTGALTAAAPSAAADEDDGSAELLDIFLDEAREVVFNGVLGIDALRADPSDLTQQTALRRAFHTLKGSSRMVGLTEFGEAGWALEQLMNAWLADQRAADAPLCNLANESLRAFGRWVEDIAAGDASAWSARPFRTAADALRLDARVLQLEVPGADPLPDAPSAAGDTGADAAAAQPALDPEALLDATPPVVPSGFGPTQLMDTLVDDLRPAPEQLPEPAAVAEDISFDEFAQATQAMEAPAAPATPPQAPPSSLDALPFELPDLDFAQAGSPPADPPATPDALALSGDAPAFEEPEAAAPAAEPDSGRSADAEPAAAAQPIEADASTDTQSEPADESTKVIGDLRIGIPLYNVYLNEADEWSRRLETELGEWALELHNPLSDRPAELAHALAGSSATVGFQALSNLSRTLESALLHVQLQGHGTADQARTFVAAAEDIRRLLHQFAAGFLKEPDGPVLDALREIIDTEVASTLAPLPDDLELQPVALVDDEPAAADDVAQAAGATQPPLADGFEAGAGAAHGFFADPVSTPKAPEAPEPSQTAEYASNALVASVPPPLFAIEKEADVPSTTPAAHAPVQDVDDDIDVVDAIDPDLFPIFEEEADELMPQLGGALRQWHARPDNGAARGEVLRVLHTLKGSARLAGALRLGELAHRLESAIEHLDSHAPAAAQVEPLLAQFDTLQTVFDRLRVQAAAEPQAVPEPAVQAVDAASAPAAPADAADAPVPRRPAVQPATVAPLAPLRQVLNQSVRVRAQLLDRLVNQAGEVMISRSRLEARAGQLRSSLGDLSGNLERLRQQLRDIEVQAETQMQSRMAQSRDSTANFDPLEFDRFTRVQELTRMMAESVNDVATVQRNLQRALEGTEDELIAQGRQARELQRDLLRTRMVEFEGIAERLYAVVRQASKETAKQIKLDITGGSIEMDRGVLDRMTPAFEHLLRNAVAHGIETPEARSAAGKPAAGTITVGLHQEGNDVAVEFRDDGAGLNLRRIREKAQAQGLVKDGAALSDADAAQLIFQAGFSTAEQVTGLAGRGIGMDVVRAEVNALGGRIETQSNAGQGTAFRMVLPLTTAVTQVVMLRAGALTIGVPASVVEIVRRVPPADIDRALASGRFDTGTEEVPFYWAGALLQAVGTAEPGIGRTRPVLVFRSAAQRLAVQVDEVLGNQEVVVKNLGPQLARLPGLAGMSVLASGAVVLIYNPVALATVYGEQVHAQQAAIAQQAAGGAQAEVDGAAPLRALPALPAQVPLVLVVDDSITVRRVTQRLLQREGYRVALAADGLQALEKLQDEKPLLVLSDIEMPRMDGFDLARNIRADERWSDLPIVMITSRIAAKHREHAEELGVNHYLGKPYSEEELLALVRGYTRAAAQIAESATEG